MCFNSFSISHAVDVNNPEIATNDADGESNNANNNDGMSEASTESFSFDEFVNATVQRREERERSDRTTREREDALDEREAVLHLNEIMNNQRETRLLRLEQALNRLESQLFTRSRQLNDEQQQINHRQSALERRERDAHANIVLPVVPNENGTPNETQTGAQQQQHEPRVDVNIIRQIDIHLAMDVKDRPILIDPDVIVYVMSNHLYALLPTRERNRLNSMRQEIARIQTVIRTGGEQPVLARNIPMCPVCFDNFATVSKEFHALECGHVCCHRCIRTIENTGPNPPCPVCQQIFSFYQTRRLFFSLRD